MANEIEEVNRRYGTDMSTGDRSEMCLINDASNRLQRLLFSDRYEELEDKVLIEDQFIEVTEEKEPIRQVTLGMTRDNFMVAKHVIMNYKEHPWVYLDTESDLEISDFEMESIIPLCFVKFSINLDEADDLVLKVQWKTGRIRNFILSNINTDRAQRWVQWIQNVDLLNQDPYGYMKMLYSQYNISFEDETDSSDTTPPTPTPVSMRAVSVVTHTPGHYRDLDDDGRRHVGVQVDKPRKKWWKVF